MADPIGVLNQLQDDGLLVWPIDLEMQEPSEATAAETLDAWFDGKDWRGTGHRVVQIGQDGTGSLFGLWHYPELEGPPPVIMLGSEGEMAVIADNAIDFAQQICCGRQWWPYEAQWRPVDVEEIDPADEDALDLAALRRRGNELLGDWVATSAAVMNRAARHPSFEAWVEGVLGG